MNKQVQIETILNHNNCTTTKRLWGGDLSSLVLNLNIWLSCGNQVMVACQHKLKKHKSWSHYQIFWQAHQKFYGTQMSSLNHFDSRLAVSKINSIKLQQKSLSIT